MAADYVLYDYVYLFFIGISDAFSSATPSMCGRKFNDNVMTDFLLSLSVK